MKKFLLFPVLVLTLLLAGCSAEKEINTNVVLPTADYSDQMSKVKIVPDKIEVFLFHSTQRCTTCIAIGRLAGETVNEYFQPELKSGKIEFREINIDLPENRELAYKFQASGSSLFLNVISNKQDNITEDINVWRLIQNEIQFKNYLKSKIDNLLGK